jgi:hypothetical protein
VLTKLGVSDSMLQLFPGGRDFDDVDDISWNGFTATWIASRESGIVIKITVN